MQTASFFKSEKILLFVIFTALFGTLYQMLFDIKAVVTEHNFKQYSAFGKFRNILAEIETEIPLTVKQIGILIVFFTACCMGML